MKKTVTLQTIIQQELEKLAKDLRESFKNIKFPVKIRDIHKVEEKYCISISVFACENKEKKTNLTMLLPKILSL